MSKSHNLIAGSWCATIVSKTLSLRFAANIAEKVLRTPLTALLLISSIAVSSCSDNATAFNSIDITGAIYGKDFNISDQNGVPRRLKDFEGKVVVLFFGYTHCPDVCPTSLSELVKVKQLLGVQGGRMQGLFVTVDPDRDTPDVLSAYMGVFDSSFIGLIPTQAQLKEIADDFKIYFKKVDGKSRTSYTMDHSAGTYIYDARGHLRLYAKYVMDAASLAHDIQILLRQTR